ncbi:Sorting nexin, C-terminal [Phytophthora cactorum]|nr:Sorting nexin, C-terminal [Phytophthora cactorum]
MYDECPEMRSSARSLTKVDLTSPRRDSMGTNTGSDSDEDAEDNQYYWEYLARDRPGAESFNAHWRFVASHCPSCSPCESFVSTRGVQWLLGALANGSLGTFCAELYTHSDVTELFYESFAILFDGTLMETVVRTLSQLDKLKVCFDEPTTIDAGESSDSETPNSSWEYAKTFDDNFHEKEKKLDSVRRRRWIRRRYQLPPVLALASPPMTHDAFKGQGSNRKDAMLRRRSKSFDKEMPDSPIGASTLAMIDSDDSHQTSTKTSAFMKARASILAASCPAWELAKAATNSAVPYEQRWQFRRFRLSPLNPGINRAGSTKFEITVKIKDDSAYAWSVIKTFHDFEVLEKQLAEKLKKQEKKCGVGCQACHLRGIDYMEMISIKPSLKTVAAATLTYEKRLYVLDQFLQQLLACDTLCQSSVVQKFLLLANAYGASLAASRDEDARPRKIEVSLFAVLGEVFEFDGIGMVRRQIFSMTRSFIKAFLGASHFRMLERQFLSFTDPKKLSGWIGDLRLYIFPDPSDASVVPPPAPDIQVLRKYCLEAILASFPSKALSLFGDTACENAALKLHEFLQHEAFVKNLLFSITDELLVHLFPDSTHFKGKKVAGGASSAAPAPCLPLQSRSPPPSLRRLSLRR